MEDSAAAAAAARSLAPPAAETAAAEAGRAATTTTAEPCAADAAVLRGALGLLLTTWYGPHLVWPHLIWPLLWPHFPVAAATNRRPLAIAHPCSLVISPRCPWPTMLWCCLRVS